MQVIGTASIDTTRPALSYRAARALVVPSSRESMKAMRAIIVVWAGSKTYFSSGHLGCQMPDNPKRQRGDGFARTPSPRIWTVSGLVFITGQVANLRPISI